jgi:ppGpp synthetase/RelA/SpoT-type nucleotidyltranferase
MIEETTIMKNLELNATRLEMAGRTNEQSVVNCVSTCGITNLCYAYKTRVKPEGKLIEKVHRKIKEKPEYLIERITDVIGLRLITLFKNEIPKILDEVLLLIQHKKNIHPNPFQENSLEEVVIYTSGSAHDPLLTELNLILAERNVKPKITPSKEGYSSVHIVTRMTHTARLKRNDSDFEHFLPVEIQIRSVFEDAWGEIDHKFGYVLRSGKIGEDDNLLFNSSLVQPHLRVLKQFTDACAQYADTIYASAHTPLSIKDSSGKIAPVPSDDEVLQRFQTLGTPQIFSKKYVEGRLLRERALTLMRTNRVAGQAECLKAAAYFLTLYQEASIALEGMNGLRLYLFYAQMNEALCLLSTDSPQHVKTAEMMYLKLRETYPNFVLVQFRLAQAEARLGNIDEAIQLFIATQKAVEEGGRKYEPLKIWPDELPETDFRHMAALLPKLMGYQFWKKSEKEPDRIKKMDLLLHAHDVTSTAVVPKHEQPHKSNNLVYYAVGYLSLVEGSPTIITKRLATSLHTNLASMEESLRSQPENVDISTLDTMMEAYHFLGNIDLAQKMAKKILGSAKTLPEGDAEEDLSIIKGALHIQTLEAVSKPANTA